MDKFKTARLYENNLDVEKRKRYGIYYTPKEIVEYIVENTVEKLDLLKNPCPKILDSSCGCGNFLIYAFEKLKNMFMEKSDELYILYGQECFKKENISKYILENCIYGTDIDSDAIEITKKLLLEESDELYILYGQECFKKENISKYILENCIYGTDIDSDAIEITKKLLLEVAGLCKNEISLNIFNEDGLKIKWGTKFDVIIGNPPYVGHKLLTKEYKKFVLSEYKEVYSIFNEDGLKIKWGTKFDVIIGNPPYVGHKLLTKEYKKFVLSEYKEVYRDKSDLYFCFYKNSLDLLKEDGVIHLITPRYFLESMSAELLRKYIEENAEIEEIIDFLGGHWIC